MFTAIAFIATLVIAWQVGRLNEQDRPQYDRLDDVEAARALLLHIRQDLKLIAFVLMGIMVMLGIIADVGIMRGPG